MAATQTKKTTWCVIYCGAPYGIGEAGHVVSRHRTEDAARKALAALQTSPKYYGSNSRVEAR